MAELDGRIEGLLRRHGCRKGRQSEAEAEKARTKPREGYRNNIHQNANFIV
jgi:hypothetical protein